MDSLPPAKKPKKLAIRLDPTDQIRLETDLMNKLGKSLHSLQDINLGTIREAKLDKLKGELALYIAQYLLLNYKAAYDLYIINAAMHSYIVVYLVYI